ncbi:unnamed protein product [Arabidopsis thaliana]|uniref:F-box domain-containing protein n=1 Tax=Arabidopsis thaliana TaxID=3702 RepID=A0A5S9XT92_ARATH|nr:unnamed protein product [Arabidopsis thaliana]
MTTMSDLSPDLVGEILTRVPMTSLISVRCTCKMWNALSKEGIFFKAARNQFMGFTMMDSRVCSMKFDLQGIGNNEQDFVDPCIKQIAKLDQIEVSKVLQCDGLLLCVGKDNSRLLVWNPYLGQTRFIKPRKRFNKLEWYALGYDNNHNYKILMNYDTGHLFGYEIYDFSSDSWRVLDVSPDCHIPFHQQSVSLNGNTYFLAQEKIIVEGEEEEVVDEIEKFLLCFDFTTERFGPRLPLPFHSDVLETVAISCVRDDQLSVLYQRFETWEIWVTTKIDPTAVSWSMFLSVDMEPPTGCQFDDEAGSFFIDEENKVAVFFNSDLFNPRVENRNRRYPTAYIIGQDGYFKSATLREAPDLVKPDPYLYCCPLVWSSYAPSLVQL